MNTFDLLIIIILLFGALMGWKRGVFTSALSFIGLFIVIIASYYLKNPVSAFMYEKLPFIKFGGIFTGISSFNILFYEALAYLICIVVLYTLLHIFMSVSGLLDKILTLTFVFTIPSKILGLIFGLLKWYVIVFFIIFTISVIPATQDYLDGSYLGNKILENTPVLTGKTEEIYSSFREIFDICVNYKKTDKEGRRENNYKTLETLMKNGIISPESVQDLVDMEKLDVDNVDELIAEYSAQKSDNKKTNEEVSN